MERIDLHLLDSLFIKPTPSLFALNYELNIEIYYKVETSVEKGK